MRSRTLTIGAAIWLGAMSVRAQEAPLPNRPPATGSVVGLRPLSLGEALSLTASANPALRSKRAQIAAVQGAQAQAGALFRSNPEVSTALTRRVVPRDGTGSQRDREWNVGLSQAIEIGGQRGMRRDAAAAAAAGLAAEIADTERQARAEVAERFHRVLALQQRLELEANAVALFQQTAAAVEKRRAAGEDTRLDANLASVEAERARNQLAIVEEELLEVRSELAARLQLDPSTLPQAVGELAIVPTGYTVAQLIDGVLLHPRLRALAERENAAAARVRLERANRLPEITAGIAVGREGPGAAQERLTTLSVSVPLPIFNRNEAAIGQALTDQGQAEIEREATARDLRASVMTLATRLISLETRVRRLQQSVLPALTDNERLSQRSRAAGQIGLLELIVVSRQSLDARRDLIDALTDYHAARIALELAAGWPRQD